MNIPINTHFCERARERAGVENPEALFLNLCRALRDERHDVIEHVFDINDAGNSDRRFVRSIYRFRIDTGGIFYAVVTRPMMRPITFLTREQMLFYREKRRWHKPKGRKCRRVCK